MTDMTITFTDSVETATFDEADGSIQINLSWWGSLSNADKALIIVHELESLVAWRKRISEAFPHDYEPAVSPRNCAVGGEEDSSWT